MAHEIHLAGFTLTADEWDGLDAEIRAELLPADGVSSDEDLPAAGRAERGDPPLSGSPELRPATSSSCGFGLLEDEAGVVW
jgi:hypothetical protein